MRRVIFLLLVILVSIPLLAAQDGCDTERTKQYEKKLRNVDDLMKNQPGSEVEFSMDRYLLDERNTRFNNPNKMSYLYVVLLDGTWLKVTIVGKLTSTSKRLTAPDHLDEPQPDEMGVYGQSDPAKVGMTTIGSLLEFGGFVSYVYSEIPLSFVGLDKRVIELVLEVTPEERSLLFQKLEEARRQAR